MKNPMISPKMASYGSSLRGVILCCWMLAGLTFPYHTALAADHPMTVSIGSHPSNKKVCIGGTATFSVTATGSGTLIYQWQLSTNGGSTWSTLTNGSTYSGVATATLTVTGATASFNNYYYRCGVTDNTAITVNSNPGVLTVGPLGQLLNASSSICSAGSGGLTSADINAGYTYQWQVSADNGGSWNNIADNTTYTGSATAALNIGGDPSLNGYLYRTIVTDGTSGCSVTSVGVDTLHIVNNPSVLQPTPTSAFICPGANATIAITDSTGVSYQWRASTDGGSTWSNISDNSLYTGTSTYSLNINAPSTTASYDVVRSVTGYSLTCSTPSLAVALTFKTLPNIVTSPVNSTVCANSNASFRVSATGSTLAYQWQSDNGTGGATWTNITPGGTSVTLSRASVTTLMEGYKYRVIVTGCGSPLTSGAAILHVNSSGTWLGTTDTAWEHSGNWCGGVPTSVTDVLVPATAPRMPLISAGTVTAYAHSLTIQKFATLSISGGTTSMTAPFNIAGTVIYMANGNQNILPADHGSLQIDNAGNKLMQSNVAITDTLTLKGSAMLVTGSNTLSMKAGSYPIRGASFSGSQTSWVVTGNGGSGAGNTGTGGLQIAQIASSSGAVLFPVGPTPASYNPLQLTNGGATNDFTVAANDQYIPGAPAGAVIDRTWLVSAASAGTSNISLGLLWRLSDEPGTFNRANSSIVRSNGTAIVEESTSGAAAGGNPYTFSKGSFSTLTQFSVATSTMVVLANPLMSFSGQWIDNTSSGLQWSADPNVQVRSYIIQWSADGNRFTDLGTVGGEIGKTSYSFLDSRPGQHNFYRLELVGSNGNITFSRVIELSDAILVNQADLAPSITGQGITSLRLTLGKGSDIAYMVTDISGHVILRNAVHLVKGSHSLPVDISRMPGGVFFVRVTDGKGFNKVLTLVKK
ncbi:hypothetical protein Q4E93_02505 [Flavitalea sp. BT771]|uniref:hypothetical protein n=1 Tax=Flavitalea sp. BT771 TaxID=3063329 RepID=UPI0026E308B9|nr:hypothetical protein [Flavitalea sp. BT771]MDO6429442.1 hypothetical protein [Flavitalea sp. BT771]MDV6218430.1 hypothetical protein [Flavitalea sp. BT771]